MRLDPRTVSRRYLLERPGFKRPDLSIVLPAAKLVPERLEQLAATGRDHGLAIQVVRICGSEFDNGIESPVSGKFVSHHRPLSLLSVLAVAEDSRLEAVNRAAGAAIGKVILFGDASSEALAVLVERFMTQPYLGVACADRSPPATSPVDRSIYESGLAIRGDLWMALGGLDDTYRSINWALHDFLVRARAIGFATPKKIVSIEAARPGIGAKEDRKLLRRRARAAPNRSTNRARETGSSVEPDQLAIYTTITDCYDVLKPQLRSAVGGAPLVAFLDEPTAVRHEGRMRGWQSILAHFPDVGGKRASRFFKANAHLALPQSRYSLWIDASVSLVAPFSAARLAEIFLSECDVCVFRHHVRNSIYDEADICKAQGLDLPETIDRQIDRYRREGMPENTGLAELPVILRRHSKAVKNLNEAWWTEIAAGSWRDQLSFDYVVWKTGLRYATFPLSLVISNGLFVKFRREFPLARAAPPLTATEPPDGYS